MSKEGKTEKAAKTRQMTFPAAVVILVAAIAILLVGIIILGLDPHIPILINLGMVLVIGRFMGIEWNDMLDTMMKFLGSNISGVMVILMVGVVVGTFMTCGTVPLVIYYGLKVMTAKWFLFWAVLICFVIALLTGSSFTAASTVGVAFMGVGISLGIPPAVVAGAIISGALTGDKHSPFSAITNLSASVSDVTVYDTEKSLRYTTIPTLILELAMFTVMGFRYSSATADTTQVTQILTGLEAHYNLSPLAVIPLVFLLVLIFLKVPAFPALILSSLAGTVFSVLLQHVPLVECFGYMQSGYVAETGVEILDSLLSRGGLFNMASTVILIMLGLNLAGGLSKLQVMEIVTEKISSGMKSRFSVMTGTFVIAFLLTCLGGDCHMASVLTANSMKKCFERLGLDTVVMSRCLVDGSCAMFGIIPWCIGGLFFAGALGVSVAEFTPYYFIGIGTVVFTLISAATGIGVKYVKETK
ncbi:MAG: Na+/H+ antiporter NhaC family protein [Clostridia bacterium]|nr:Na+/H+ antiporter NhaC family protein [Clostridia bacterium]